MKHKLWILILCMSFCLFSAGAIRTAQAAEDGIQTASDTTAAGRTMTRVTSSSATVTDNVSDNNYSVYYASTVKSYLYENEDGGCTRVEYTSSGVVVEEYSSTFSLESTRTLELELSLWGGSTAAATITTSCSGSPTPMRMTLSRSCAWSSTPRTGRASRPAPSTVRTPTCPSNPAPAA